jgi:tetratricopeptide (TPR) repeat protein
MTAAKPEVEPPRTNIIAVILGASCWPNCPNLISSPAFLNSALRFREYLIDPDGLALAVENTLWVFDDRGAADEIDGVIGNFLGKKVEEAPARTTDILIYYTGHAGFTENDNKFFLAIQATRAGFTGSSGYRMANLARTLNAYGARVRRFLILDCCYAAAAFGDLAPQSDIFKAMHAEAVALLPESGTALLCAASSDAWAKAPRTHSYTMFSGALLEVLEKGAAGSPERLSLAAVGDLVEKHIRTTYRDLAVRPEVHSPDQRKGDIAKVPLFPNRALLRSDPPSVPVINEAAIPSMLLVVKHHIDRNDFAQAQPILDAARQLILTMKPRPSIALIQEVYNKAADILMEQNAHENLIVIMDEAIRLLADVEKAKAEFQFYKAGAYAYTGQYDQAEQILETLLSLEPENPKYLLGRAYLYWEHAETSQAIEIARRSLGGKALRDAENSLVYYLAERGQEDDLREAQARGERLVQEHPEYLPVKDTWVFVLHRLGRNEEALSLAEQICTLAPNTGAYYYTLGLVLRALGKQIYAKLCFRWVIQSTKFMTRVRREAERLLNDTRIDLGPLPTALPHGPDAGKV